MMFTKRLREPIMSGEVTMSIRIWQRPHVKVGGRYPLGPGHIVVTSIKPIALSDITGELARRSGFEGVVDLLKVAKHGRGENVYLVEFEYDAPRVVSPAKKKKATTKAQRAQRRPRMASGRTKR